MLTNAIHLAWYQQQLAKVNCQSVNLKGVDFQPSTDVACPGVVFDTEMNFAKHI